MSEGADMSRRSFVQWAGFAAAGAAMGPFVHAADKSDQLPALGVDGFRYEVLHDWAKLPDRYKWQTTHNVALDEAGRVYISHMGHADSAPQPTVFVFDEKGQFIRAWGERYHGHGHGLDIRKEEGEEFCYLSATGAGVFAKTTLTGELVWEQGLPEQAMASGQYEPGSRFKPTNVAFLPDGGFIIGDGYGSHYLHQFDRQAQWVRTYGGRGSGDGQFRTPHSNWWDDRPGREPALAVADRQNRRLQYFSLNGEYLGKVENLLSFPTQFDIRNDVMLIADLHARLTLLDKNNQLITHLGDDPQWTAEVLAERNAMRSQPTRWQPGKFIHPHDACFDKEGNILVSEWVSTGRVSRLRKLD